MSTFKPVSTQIDFPSLEKEILSWWYSSGIVKKYLSKNSSSPTKFSFLDGPITANNPMGVHHGWGRTYKDLWQRYHTLKGDAGRYQNGFDCQGLWVEVEVEKELGFKSKKDIETYGVANFIEKCKDRVRKYSAIQTQQSQRLGYFMDWDNSYFTMSDENNYAIWDFLHQCWKKGWVYKGHDSVPWCPRCETAISQHEMLTEDYKELVHESVYLKLPLVDSDAALLIWTTTPWTIPANIAVAVDPKLDYALVDNLWVAASAAPRLFPGISPEKTVPGSTLVGLKYHGPYDHLPAVQKVISHKLFHTVVATDPLIMPISAEEGTGLVHTAVSAGQEDFQLGKKRGLPLIPVITDTADYLPDMGELAGQNAKKHPEIIIDYLKSHDFVLKTEHYKHRYPACWRCKTELVWKVADEWYIAMDKPDPDDPQKRSFRKQMLANAKKIKWLPAFGLDRELDWLKNMHDWLISKKNRYWGLALPIYECPSCGYFEVISSKAELENRAVSGWDKFTGHSPHRPWIDEVTIKCTQCSSTVTRITDVGNPWLDAGIVSVSTLPTDWFPADFITESFPGQFKNWFYSLIAMATVVKKAPPFKTVLGYGSLLAEDGRPMHKSWGNSIEFNEGADKIGVDVMRWIYASQPPESNLLFGYKVADEVRRRFHLILWNVYNFFITYANLDGVDRESLHSLPSHLTVLDTWILSRLDQTTLQVTKSLDKFTAQTAAKSIEEFVSDLSLWYVRRSRDRVGPTVSDTADRHRFYAVMYKVLTTLSQLMAPITPFMSESIYTNLTGEESVHLSSWPQTKKLRPSAEKLLSDMKILRKLVEMGLAERKTSQIKVRQPLSTVKIVSPDLQLSADLLELLKSELNIKSVSWQSGEVLSVSLDTQLTPELISEGQARDLVRQVQELRKAAGAKLDQQIRLYVSTTFSPELVELIKRQTQVAEYLQSDSVRIELL